MDRKAITLVEVVVVIVVIILAVGILVPMFLHQGEPYHARKAVCKSNLKQIGLGCKMYSNDFDEYWPRNAELQPDGTQSLALLYPEYIQTTGVFRCPWTDVQPDVDDPDGDGVFDLTTSYVYDAFTGRWPEPMKAMAGDDCGDNPSRPGFAENSNHERGAQILFFDAHVEWVNYKFNLYTGDQNVYDRTDWNDFSASYLRK